MHDLGILNVVKFSVRDDRRGCALLPWTVTSINNMGKFAIEQFCHTRAGARQWIKKAKEFMYVNGREVIDG